MSEVKKRKIHGPEFKAKVGLEAVRGVKTINEIAQEYGVHPFQVGQCKKRFWRNVKHQDVYLNGYANMGELMLGMAAYMSFFHAERAHQ